MGDVHTPRTPGWHYVEKLAIKKLDGNVSYGKSYVSSPRYSARMSPQLPSSRDVLEGIHFPSQLDRGTALLRQSVNPKSLAFAYYRR